MIVEAVVGKPILNTEIRHYGGAVARPRAEHARLERIKNAVDPESVIRSNHPL